MDERTYCEAFSALQELWKTKKKYDGTMVCKDRERYYKSKDIHVLKYLEMMRTMRRKME